MSSPIGAWTASSWSAGIPSVVQLGEDLAHLVRAADHADRGRWRADHGAKRIRVVQVAVRHDDDVGRRADGHEVGRVRRIAVDELVGVREALRGDHVAARVQDDHLVVEQLAEAAQLLTDVAGADDEQHPGRRVDVEEDRRLTAAERAESLVALLAQLVALAPGLTRRQTGEGIRDDLLLEDAAADRLRDAAVGEHEHLRPDAAGAGSA